MSEHGTLFYNSASPNCSHGYSFEVGSSLEETNSDLSLLKCRFCKSSADVFIGLHLVVVSNKCSLSPCEQFDKRERMSIVHFPCTTIRPGLAP